MVSNSKKVYLEPAWKLPVSYDYMTAFPPEGYEFVTTPQKDGLFKTASRWSQSYDLLNAADSFFPTVLAMSRFRRWRKPPSGTALTWAHGHLVFRPEPWVVEVEYASLLLGPDPKHLKNKRYRNILERTLSSPWCRAIRCWCEAGRQTLVTGLDCHGFEHKIKVVYPAVPPKQFVKQPGSGKIKLLFVGSQLPSRSLKMYGGIELLEAFALLRKTYDVEIVFRAVVPSDVKAKYGRMEGLRIIDQIVPWETLEREFQSADIGVLPNHTTTPQTILDMMSYELPVVGRKCWANPEYILDGVTGLLVQPSRKVPYYYGNTCHPNFAAREFRQAIKEPDAGVVNELAQKLSQLIENPELRKKLGKAGRYEVDHGKFSIRTRNEKLKQIFDEAIGENG